MPGKKMPGRVGARAGLEIIQGQKPMVLHQHASTDIEQSKRIVTLLDQDRMGLFATKDLRLSACDLAVLAEITDRIMKVTGVSRPTSITHLEKETGRHSRSVRNSVEKLLDLQYIAIAAEGRGTRGTEFVLNVAWLRHVGNLIDVEVERQKAAKEKASLRPRNHSSAGELACANTRTLIPEGWVPSRSLRELVCAPDSTQSYESPAKAGDYVEISSGAPGAGLSAAPGAEDMVGEITSAGIERDEGEDILTLELDDDPEKIVSIVIQSDDIHAQEEGQRELNQLAGAVGVTFENDADVKRCKGRFVAIRYQRVDVDRIARHIERWAPLAAAA